MLARPRLVRHLQSERLSEEAEVVIVRFPPGVPEMEPDLKLRAEAASLAPADEAGAPKVLRRVATPPVASDRELLPAIARVIELQGV